MPFSNKPGSQPIVLMNGDFASLDRFDHQAENYRFSALVMAIVESDPFQKRTGRRP